jgi:hypothetical protein
VPPTALLTVFSHGFSIRNRSTAANFGYLSMIILMVGTVFILDPFMWLENEYSIAKSRFGRIPARGLRQVVFSGCFEENSEGLQRGLR